MMLKLGFALLVVVLLSYFVGMTAMGMADGNYNGLEWQVSKVAMYVAFTSLMAVLGLGLAWLGMEVVFK